MASCTDWLDYKPFDEVSGDDVYRTEALTGRALNGLYIRLAGSNLYGQSMSVSTLEVLGQNFYWNGATASGTPALLALGGYDYTSDNVKGLFSNIWNASYRAIAEANEFLENVEKNKDNYSSAAYNLYMGEAIAIRTLLHFDLLRLFGPVPTPANYERPAIPYYNSSTAAAQDIITADSMMRVLMNDIDIAIEYMSNDPILTSGLSANLNLLDGHNYLTAFRNIHMNYYGVNALKARMALWWGTPESRELAYKIASRMIAGEDPRDPAKTTNFNQVFSFVSGSGGQGRFRVFYPEVLFGIHNTRITQVNRAMFTNEDGNGHLVVRDHFYNWLYTAAPAGPDGGIAGTGVRANMWTQEVTVANDGSEIRIFRRLTRTTSDTAYPHHPEFQGVIRLGELYLIAAETAPDVETKRGYVARLRTGKGYGPGDNTGGVNEATLDQIIEMEFRKETYGEGQWFFFAKRRNLASFRRATMNTAGGTPVAFTASWYTPPIPEQETDLRVD